MTDRPRPRPIVLVVLDGFGVGPDPAADDRSRADGGVAGLLARWPHALLRASEDAVGLPPGQMGNSEVGHLNLGAGRPVLQDLPRIDAAIADGSFFARPALIEACRRAARPGGRLHVISLVGPGGVHANDRHLVALVDLAARSGVPSVRVHALLDGRDTPPRSARGFVEDFETRLPRPPGCQDRHGRRSLLGDGSRQALGAHAARLRRDRPRAGGARFVGPGGDRWPYARGENDEFVTPTVIDGVEAGSATATRSFTPTSGPTEPVS